MQASELSSDKVMAIPLSLTVRQARDIHVYLASLGWPFVDLITIRTEAEAVMRGYGSIKPWGRLLREWLDISGFLAEAAAWTAAHGAGA